MRVVVIGAGGVGGWLINGLVKLLEYGEPGSALIIVDGDDFEPKNHTRQAFNDIGNKAVVRAEELQPYHAQTFIIPMNKWVVSGESLGEPTTDEDGVVVESDKVAVEDLINDGDVVFCVVDNFAARSLVFDYARNLDNIDVFTGGNDDALFCSVYHYQRRDGADVTDHPAVMHDEFVNPPDRNPGEMGCMERAMLEGGTQLLATNMTVAALLLGRFQHTIVDSNEVAVSEIMIDLGLGQLGAFDRRVDAKDTAVVLV